MQEILEFECPQCHAAKGESLQNSQGSPAPERFCLVRDESGHWYAIPFAQRDAWQAWIDGVDSDDLPEYAVALNCHPSNISFTDWRQE